MATPTPKPTKPLEGKVMVTFGDSITAWNDGLSYIEDVTGAEIINVGLGATTMGIHGTWVHDPFSFQRLATSLAAGDLSAQRALINNWPTNYDSGFKSNFSKLETLDLNQVDIITILYGTNDYIGIKPLGSADDQVPGSFSGNLNSGINALLGRYPHLDIVLMTPPWRYNQTNMGGRSVETQPNRVGIYLREFGDSIINIGRRRGIPVLDLYRLSGINESTAGRYLKDSVHPSTEGYGRINGLLADLLIDIY